MSFYEGPSTDPELMKLTQQRPTAIQEAMLQTLRAGRWSGYIKPDIDLPTLADRICQTMLQVGLDVMRHTFPPTRSPRCCAESFCRGWQPGRPPTRRWTGPGPSPPPRRHRDVVATTATPTPATKRRTFVPWHGPNSARKGYEVTTIRDIASAAGLGTGTVYRVIGSKDELLASIMESFGKKGGGGLGQRAALGRHAGREAGCARAGSTSMRWTSFPTSGGSNSPGCGNRRQTRPTRVGVSPCDCVS